jgi:energy-coupling factor transport system permease protein
VSPAPRPMLHPVTWLAWLGVAVAAITLTRNPLYLLLLLLLLALVAELVRPLGRLRPLDPILFATITVAIGGIFNALTIHYGDTVLLRLPASWPLIGGAITLEALAYGMTNGLVLGALIAAFTAFGAAMPVGALLRLVPRAFYPLAVVVAIAVTYVPLTIRHAGQVREAQQLRGHTMRSWRDLLPLLLPLLIGGLERALQLAEALAARGFAADRPSSRLRLLLTLGLACAFAGVLLRIAWGQNLVGGGLLLGGAGLALGALHTAGQQTPRSHYRTYGWGRGDALALAGLSLTLAVLLLPWPGQASRFYTPYPTLSTPPFEPLLALGLLGLLAPLLIYIRRGASHDHV